MKLAVVTQAVDTDDPVLGATVPKLRALAERVDELVVLALREGEHSLPGNVRIKPIGASSQAQRGLRFARALAPERPDAVLAHMAPIYALLAAPIARPVLLWFTHPQDSRLLRVATRVSHAVLTVDERSFPFASPKVRAIGHGVDVARFACREAVGREPLRALALGRFSDVKNYDLIQHAVDRVTGVEVEFVGPGEPPAGLRATRPAVPWTQVPELFGEFDLFVSATKAGSADKAVFEAGASCLPVLASSPAFASLLPEELRFSSEDELVQRLEALKSANRGALGRELRARVVHDHSVDHWADEVLRAV